jgi:Mechanosensitive ion channel
MSRYKNMRQNEPHASARILDELRAIEFRIVPDFRKTLVFGLIALGALIAGDELGGVNSASPNSKYAAYGCALLVAVFGIAASRTAAREVQRIAVHHGGNAAGTPLRITVLLVGYLIAIIAFCDLMNVDVGHLLIGGAITGIVLGLAAQPVLGNLFAGLVLLFARPYVAGERIRVLSGSINGPHEGVVVSAGLLYTTLETPDGPLNIPNSTLLAAAVGPKIKLAVEPADAPPPAATQPGPGSPAPAVDDGAGQNAHDLATAIAEGEAVAAAERQSAQDQPSQPSHQSQPSQPAQPAQPQAAPSQQPPRAEPPPQVQPPQPQSPPPPPAQPPSNH